MKLLGRLMIVLGALVFVAFAAPAPRTSAPAPVVEPVNAVGFEVDGQPQVIAFVFADGSVALIGAKDCADAAPCLRELARLGALKHLRVIDVKTGEKV